MISVIVANFIDWKIYIGWWVLGRTKGGVVPYYLGGSLHVYILGSLSSFTCEMWKVAMSLWESTSLENLLNFHLGSRLLGVMVKSYTRREGVTMRKPSHRYWDLSQFSPFPFSTPFGVKESTFIYMHESDCDNDNYCD